MLVATAAQHESHLATPPVTGYATASTTTRLVQVVAVKELIT